MRYILWGISWQQLVLMLSDAPRYTKSSATAERTERIACHKQGSALSIFKALEQQSL